MGSQKLNWVNAHYIKHSDDAALARAVAPRIAARGGDTEKVDLTQVVALLKDRAETLEQLADGAMLFCGAHTPASPELATQHLTDAARTVLKDFATQGRGARMEPRGAERFDQSHTGRARTQNATACHPVACSCRGHHANARDRCGSGNSRQANGARTTYINLKLSWTR